MIKEIITYPNPILRKKAQTIVNFDDELKKIIHNMTETMFDAPGAGLAAPQIGISQRIVVINISNDNDNIENEGEEKVLERKALALINPEIIEGSGSNIDTEGCLSILEYSTKVKRFSNIKVKAFDPDGKEMEFDAEDFFARVIQHEVDHLEGVLFIDRISSLKRNLYKKRLKKILIKEQEENNVPPN